MTNTLTTDTKLTIEQINRIEEEGADLVRVSCPDEASTLALKEISRKCKLTYCGRYPLPLQERALEAADNGAACLRINPGNIGIKKNKRGSASCKK